MKSFADLGISKSVVGALAARGITAPFPGPADGRQRRARRPRPAGPVPDRLGKTLAFGIPTVDSIEPGDGLAALVLAPTRELASQIVDELDSIARARGLRIAAVYGGVGFGPQSNAARRANIVVATPGRLEDLLGRNTISLDQVQVLVLDEADRMLDMGFKPAVSRIVAQTPDDRQTLFFSATLEGATGKLAAAYTHNARRHTQEPTEHKERDIEHSFVHVESQSAKLDHLTVQLKEVGRGRTLVFVRTKRGADRLVKRLRSREVESVAMHGDKTQGQRERALARFEKGEVDTLIATDVAARGIDVADVTHVINFDAPGDQDAYTHRIGRTGRAGNRGAGISFVLADQVVDMSKIARDLGLAREFDLNRPTGSGRTETASTPRPSSNPNSNGNASGAQKRRRRRRRSKAKVAA